MLKKNAANFITCLRILGTAALMTTEAMSDTFMAVYIFTGITDILDGYVARKTGTVSCLGSKLDSISDLFFYAVMLIMMVPTMKKVLPAIMWVVIWSTLAMRAFSYSYAAIKYKEFASLHTKLNKLTGFATFTIPFVFRMKDPVPFCWVIAAIAVSGTVYELGIHISGKREKIIKTKKKTESKV